MAALPARAEDPPSPASAPAPATAPAPAPAPAPARSIKDQKVTAVDVVATPVSDLGLRKGKIPPVLEAAVADPFDLTGLKTCPQLSVAVNELDTLLGPDAISRRTAPRS